MPYQPSVGSNASFMSGVSHAQNESGHENNYSLGNDARSGQDVDPESDRWADLTPIGVTPPATSGQDDAPFEQMERTQGAYSPGQMPNLTDKIEQGSDDEA